MIADADGRYGVWSVKPAAYPIPGDGAVGKLLAAAHRRAMRPAHIHFMVGASGHRTGSCASPETVAWESPFLPFYALAAALSTSADLVSGVDVSPWCETIILIASPSR